MARRILVVEDDPDALDALALVLASRGFEVATALDGEAGVARAIEFRPDVLVCDSVLPGIDGVATARAIHAATGTAIVFVTAHSLADLRARAVDLPVHAFLNKPIDLERLSGVIAELDSK